jgi:hypothetical protein
MTDPSVGPDGTLTVLSADKKVYSSKDGGHTFEQGDLATQTWPGTWTRAGYIYRPGRNDMPSGAYPYQLAGVSGEIPRP